MYVGHLAVALAVPRARLSVPLWLLLLAAQGPDWVELIVGTRGASGDAAKLWSHTIPAVAFGALLLSAAYGAVSRNWRAAPLVAMVYATHPLLDLVTGSKVLWPGGRMVGASLYNIPAADFCIEIGFALAGWWLYQRHLHPARRRTAVWLVLAVLVVAQAALDAGQSLRLAHQATGELPWPFDRIVP